MFINIDILFLFALKQLLKEVSFCPSYMYLDEDFFLLADEETVLKTHRQTNTQRERMDSILPSHKQVSHHQ